MPKEFNPRRLDIPSFAEEGGTLSGEETVGRHPRLLAETQGRGGELPLRWAAQGTLRNPGHVRPQPWLHLRADTVLSLSCQRCLAPVEVEVEVDRHFRFVADEQTAAAEDDVSEEDVLAVSRSLDLAELLEDEFLMELPVAPVHEVCPVPVKTEAVDEGYEEAARRAENPFAQLQKLKTGKD